jgi:hypothetical protein
MTYDQTDAREAVRDFAAAAGRLLDLWITHDTPGEVGDLLTQTYPRSALAMSFDEVVAELWAWHEQMAEASDDVLISGKTYSLMPGWPVSPVPDQ